MENSIYIPQNTAKLLKDSFMPGTTWMNFGDIVLSAISQSQKTNADWLRLFEVLSHSVRIMGAESKAVT